VCIGISVANDQAAALACSTPEQVANGGTAGGVIRTEKGLTVYGVVPDGPSGVTVQSETGQVSAPVLNNAFAIELASRPTSVSWNDASGTSHSHGVLAGKHTTHLAPRSAEPTGAPSADRATSPH
jgi:hypothetical protein